MEHLFVIVGMSNVGKTTLIRTFCEIEHTFEYFKNDPICREIRRLFNVEQFDVRDTKQWAQLESLGNVSMASFWLHVNILLQVKGRIAFAEGYRYYYEPERRILAAAVGVVFGSCDVHFLHLNPSLERRNAFREKRGIGPLTQEQLVASLAVHDLSFVEYEIHDSSGLARVVSEVAGEGVQEVEGSPFIDVPGLSFVQVDDRRLSDIIVKSRRWGGLRRVVAVQFNKWHRRVRRARQLVLSGLSSG